MKFSSINEFVKDWAMRDDLFRNEYETSLKKHGPSSTTLLFLVNRIKEGWTTNDPEILKVSNIEDSVFLEKSIAHYLVEHSPYFWITSDKEILSLEDEYGKSVRDYIIERIEDVKYYVEHEKPYSDNTYVSRVEQEYTPTGIRFKSGWVKGIISMELFTFEQLKGISTFPLDF